MENRSGKSEGRANSPLPDGKGTPAPLCPHTPDQASLHRLVAGFTRDEMLQQDLLQECLFWLWRTQAQGPPRTRSWYLQSCRFLIQHWLTTGRSLDSPKRARGEHRISLDDAEETLLTEYHTEAEMFETISCRDVIGTLAQHLSFKERAVLRGLAEGWVLREVAVRCELSYPTALKYRRKIAGLTIKLGIASTQFRAGA